jgi:hypothetical protein
MSIDSLTFLPLIERKDIHVVAQANNIAGGTDERAIREFDFVGAFVERKRIATPASAGAACEPCQFLLEPFQIDRKDRFGTRRQE